MGVTTYRLRHLARNPSPIKDWLAYREMTALLDSDSFQLVHTHTSKAGVLGRLAAHSRGVPVIHTPHGHIFYGYFGPVLTKLFVLVERAIALKTSMIVSLTDIETRESLERGIGKAEQYTTIHSGVPLQPFTKRSDAIAADFRERHSIPPEALLFVSVGRLTAVKGFDVLLNAFAKAQFNGQACLAIVGAGAERASLEKQAAALEVTDRTRFVGELEDVRPALWAADAFALTSRNEGMGRALVEAMAAGLAAVATDVGGIPSVLRDGETGLLVPKNDADACSRALVQLEDKTLRTEMGIRAADSVYPEYDEGSMIRQLAKLYGDLA